ncbi:7545_t:CDS:2, partial [Gigaspora rosea]
IDSYFIHYENSSYCFVLWLTKVPEQNNYMMVLDYLSDGDLRSYLDNLHPGNIFKNDEIYWLGDFGFAIKQEFDSTGEIFGIMLYVENMTINIIINNLRPSIIHGLPSKYKEIIEKCEFDIPKPDITHIGLSTDMI